MAETEKLLQRVASEKTDVVEPQKAAVDEEVKQVGWCWPCIPSDMLCLHTLRGTCVMRNIVVMHMHSFGCRPRRLLSNCAVSIQP